MVPVHMSNVWRGFWMSVGFRPSISSPMQPKCRRCGLLRYQSAAAFARPVLGWVAYSSRWPWPKSYIQYDSSMRYCSGLLKLCQPHSLWVPKGTPLR